MAVHVVAGPRQLSHGDKAWLAWTTAAWVALGIITSQYDSSLFGRDAISVAFIVAGALVGVTMLVWRRAIVAFTGSLLVVVSVARCIGFGVAFANTQDVRLAGGVVLWAWVAPTVWRSWQAAALPVPVSILHQITRERPDEQHPG